MVLVSILAQSRAVAPPGRRELAVMLSSGMPVVCRHCVLARVSAFAMCADVTDLIFLEVLQW